MRISDWSSDVCSSDLCTSAVPPEVVPPEAGADDDRRYLVEHFSVPRETMGRLSDYATLLVEWQARMNLVGPATLPHLWARHFLDSAQLLDHAPGRSEERREGKSVSVRVDLGGRRIIQKKITTTTNDRSD